MEVRHLRSFVAAAELGSFTAAAMQLDVTQAAISQQLAVLEGELKVSLFRRLGRGAARRTRHGDLRYRRDRRNRGAK